jgi:predicted DNA-binding ribbon-helix-helix protein|tara:strand:+ start:77 stop:328 length:252 start_codon:yes stop_codon:yes gene_type:complete
MLPQLIITSGDIAMHRKRHLTLPNLETSVLLERTFWDTVDILAGKEGWQSWVTDILKDKPADIGRATWIRTTAHNRMRELANV